MIDTPDLVASDGSVLHPFTHFVVQTAAVTASGLVLFTAFGVLLLGAVHRFQTVYACGGGVEQARTDAQSVRGAVEMYLAQNPEAACPTVEQLVSERILSSRTRTEDPWENKFRVTCDGEDVTVTSAGPDGRFGGEDDVE